MVASEIIVSSISKVFFLSCTNVLEYNAMKLNIFFIFYILYGNWWVENSFLTFPYSKNSWALDFLQILWLKNCVL